MRIPRRIIPCTTYVQYSDIVLIEKRFKHKKQNTPRIGKEEEPQTQKNENLFEDLEKYYDLVVTKREKDLERRGCKRIVCTIQGNNARKINWEKSKGN